MSNYYCNLKLYDEKGRRVALFGRQTERGLEVFELTCSKKDAFSRKMAHKVYEIFLKAGLDKVIEEGFHPELYLVSAEDVARPKWSFLRYCNENYLKMREYFYPFIGFGPKTCEIRISPKLGRHGRYIGVQTLTK